MKTNGWPLRCAPWAAPPTSAGKESRDSLDSGVFGALIWSLSQIGGEHVREALEELVEDAEDDTEIDYIESALENLEFTDNFTLTDMFDFDIDSKGDPDAVDHASTEEDEDQ